MKAVSTNSHGEKIIVTAVAAETRSRQALKSEETKFRILSAAEEVLREYGYAGLTTREVAGRAGVQTSQIHYHFGSRRGLLLGLFDYLNKRLLDRQHRTFNDDLPLWRKWDIACDYLDQDLESGYVRVLQELAAAGWSDQTISTVLREGIAGWVEVQKVWMTDLVERNRAFGPLDVDDLAVLICAMFYGAETMLLNNLESDAMPIRSSLRKIGIIIRAIEEGEQRKA